MTREYLVVYEKGANNLERFLSRSARLRLTPGDALEDTRTNMREAIEVYLNETAKAGEKIPEAIATSVDFKEFDPGPARFSKQYGVEWLAVSLPHSGSRTKATQAA